MILFKLSLTSTNLAVAGNFVSGVASEILLERASKIFTFTKNWIHSKSSTHFWVTVKVQVIEAASAFVIFVLAGLQSLKFINSCNFLFPQNWIT